MPSSRYSAYGAGRQQPKLPLVDYRDGALAGLLAGGAIMLLFFVYDLLQFTPLATPGFLSESILGSVDPGTESTTDLRAVRVATYTFLHLSAFTVLGIIFARLLRIAQLRKTLLTGALYGLTACTVAFFNALRITGTRMSSEPGWPAILLGNVAAGIVMVTFLRLAQGKYPSGRSP